jgi:hypothetical protein
MVVPEYLFRDSLQIPIPSKLLTVSSEITLQPNQVLQNAVAAEYMLNKAHSKQLSEVVPLKTMWWMVWQTADPTSMVVVFIWLMVPWKAQLSETIPLPTKMRQHRP